MQRTSMLVTFKGSRKEIVCALTYSLKLQLCAGMTRAAHTRTVTLHASVRVVYAQSKVAWLAAITSFTFHILLTCATHFAVDHQVDTSDITSTWCTVGVISKTWGTHVTLWTPKPQMTFTNSCCLEYKN
jgi:hypothetical protein